MLALAADLRAEADELENDAGDLKNDSSTRREYKEYRTNMHALRAYAQQLEDTANWEKKNGGSALRGLRIARNEKTKNRKGSDAHL